MHDPFILDYELSIIIDYAFCYLVLYVDPIVHTRCVRSSGCEGLQGPQQHRDHRLDLLHIN